MMFSLKEKAQGMVEFALILALVAVVVIAALTLLGPLVGAVFSTINASIGGAMPTDIPPIGE